MNCDRCIHAIDEDFESCKAGECEVHDSFYASNLRKELDIINSNKKTVSFPCFDRNNLI